jgi:hypothetical protein
MAKTIELIKWKEFLKAFSEQNEGKPTRIGVFVPNDGSVDDFWIGDGLMFVGVDAYQDRGKMRVDIFFDNYSHSIDGVEKIVCINGDGSERGLDISDGSGETTVLRLEDWKFESEVNHG